MGHVSYHQIQTVVLPKHTNLRRWQQNPAQGVQLVGFCSSNTEDSWPNHGRWSWRGWLSVAVGDQVGRQPVTVNCGTAGDTSTGLQAHGERDVQSLDPMLVVVTIGGNDQR